jgi:hypothetical protein
MTIIIIINKRWIAACNFLLLQAATPSPMTLFNYYGEQ